MSRKMPVLGSPFSDVSCDLVEYWEAKLEKTSVRYRHAQRSKGTKQRHWRQVARETGGDGAEGAEAVRQSRKESKLSPRQQRKLRRDARKAQDMKEMLEDVIEKQQAHKDERIQRHIAAFSKTASSTHPVSQRQPFGSGGGASSATRGRGRGRGRSSHRQGPVRQPVLNEHATLQTSAYWFDPPPSKDQCLRLAMQQLTAVTSAPLDHLHDVCAVCACELYEPASAEPDVEQQQEATQEATEAPHTHSDTDDSGCGSDTAEEDSRPSPASPPPRLFIRSSSSSKYSCNSEAATTTTTTTATTTTTTTTTITTTTTKTEVQKKVAAVVPADGEEVVSLRGCKHTFHRDCIAHAFKYHTRCPVCLVELAPQQGPQPAGTMSVSVMPHIACAGHERDSRGTIVINYSFPSGRQDERHEHPGCMYSGTYRVAYLPNNKQGREVLALLQVAFDRRVIFRVGTSITTGVSNTVVWNGIHHKTYIGRGPFGYPDATYLLRVKEELGACGISA
ncbi:hypothetical protein PTSG_03813 [Salpingoeca rosetta]|uniref:RING-type E3 ubiquitin transferase n=1 Tax=Salpingoeca rosetta (strain ATCC 50818 / BSB-021) TaxID=946362 RepID=F2U5G6_SALR5|nr:uncharacterized protein PTSG_03813 [Salpingoeca rosetta]EGD83182.1 hypothetical protein PTSG_03813 [Salpingoeca rosetta]|eukprot:XP_004995546.1 hypothetical protein PTSG_03813 [Salpingoeca rosetta]